MLNIDLHCKFKFIKSSYQENAKLSDLICSNRHIYWNFARKLHIILVSRGRRWACAQYLPDGRSQLFRQVKYVNYIRFPDGRGYRFNHKELRQGSGVNSLPTCRLWSHHDNPSNGGHRFYFRCNLCITLRHYPTTFFQK